MTITPNNMDTLVQSDVEITSTSCPKGVAQACELLLKEGMYVPGWTFERWYREPFNIQKIYIARRDGIIVGCGVLRKDMERPNNGTFVRPVFRRQGIGTKILETMAKERELKPSTNWEFENFFYHCKNIGIQVNFP
jgi:hypothetical protein